MKNNLEAYNLVFGISIYDIFGFTASNYRSHDSNPGRVKVSFGGVLSQHCGKHGTCRCKYKVYFSVRK